MPTERPCLELTYELRLRRWARQNYVAAAERLATWHPVILDEMARRESEIIAHSVPMPILQLEDRRGSAACLDAA